MNWLKNLFTVPTTEKITEKSLFKVLTASVVSILLCMMCLVSTTWAWFSVTVSNDNNVMQMGTFQITYTINTPQVDAANQPVALTESDSQDSTADAREEGIYEVNIRNVGDVEGYCKVLITPSNGLIEGEASESGEPSGSGEVDDSNEADQSNSNTAITFYTEQIPVDGPISFYVILSEPSTIEVIPVWGKHEQAEGELLLGTYSVSGGDIIPTVSGGDMISTVSGGDAVNTLSDPVFEEEPELIGDGDILNEDSEIINAGEGADLETSDEPQMQFEDSVSENEAS